MSELPVEISKTTGGAAPSGGTSGSFDQAPRWSLRRVLVLLAVIVGVGATLTDVFLFQAFATKGALTLIGILAAAALLLLALSSSLVRDPSQAHEAAGEALDALPDPCYVADRRGAVLFANEAYRNLIGVVNDERPVPLERLLAGRDALADTVFRLAQAARTGFAADEEIRFVPRAGALERVYKVVVRPMRGQAGGAVWLLRDLTIERERVDMAEQDWRRVLAFLSTTPFGFYAAKMNGDINFINSKLAGWLGTEAGRTEGRPRNLSEFVVGDTGALTRGADIEGAVVADIDLRSSEGRVFPVRSVQTLVQGGPTRDPMYWGLVLDRTTGDKAEESARDAEMRFARFFNNAPIGIATVDSEGRIDNANSAFLAYVGEGVQRGTNLCELVIEDDRAGVMESLAASRAGRMASAAIEVRLANSSERVGLLYISRVDVAEGSSSTVAYLIDATEQKSLELQFAQSQKMQAIGQLAGGVAHDFNNLLTAIIGFCDLLLARHQAGDPSFSDVMQIKQNANRAANLTRQLLAFSRRQTLRPKVLSLTDALAELQNLLSRLLTETVELKIVHGRDLGLVKVDQNQLDQVIMNLAVNARDAMPEGGKLTIRTANVSEEDSRALDHALMPAAEYLLIEVADTGTGIPKENLGKIFEPFYTTKDPSKGTGLGLSTVYGIVKQTGGFIFPYSTMGKGTTFRIYLPRHFETPAEAKAEAEAKAAEAAPEQTDLTGKGTILLVEDEDAVRTFAARALATRGYDVLQAESGEAALAIVEAHEGVIDLIVSDVVMPNMDGPTLIKELAGRLPGVKIIFVSGYAEDAFAKSLDPSQEFHFLPKPFSLKQLAAAVKGVMNKA
ncbi:MAG: response regulator [Parvibaculum sp.]|nr:response regulator [Parvibaculum sp.]|tara:strand:+ start:2845 stop:5379 length:2535 start_codon:yes stop_codon:yes gene_type:complete